MLKGSAIVITCMAINSFCFSQTELSKKINPSISGQVMIGGNKDELFFNLGGSGVTLNMKQSALSINFLPSLNYNINEKKVIPALGIGPQFYFKNSMIISAPLFYTYNQWHVTLGIGCRFNSITHHRD